MSVVVLLGLLAGASVGAALGRLARLPLWPLTGGLIGSGAVHLAIGGGVAPRATAWSWMQRFQRASLGRLFAMQIVMPDAGAR